MAYKVGRYKLCWYKGYHSDKRSKRKWLRLLRLLPYSYQFSAVECPRAEYLREADETFARLYCAEPFNRLFDTVATARRDGSRKGEEAHGLLSFEEMLGRAREIRERSSRMTAAQDIRADRDR